MCKVLQKSKKKWRVTNADEVNQRTNSNEDKILKVDDDMSEMLDSTKYNLLNFQIVECRWLREQNNEIKIIRTWI